MQSLKKSCKMNKERSSKSQKQKKQTFYKRKMMILKMKFKKEQKNTWKLLKTFRNKIKKLFKKKTMKKKRLKTTFSMIFNK